MDLSPGQLIGESVTYDIYFRGIGQNLLGMTGPSCPSMCPILAGERMLGHLAVVHRAYPPYPPSCSLTYFVAPKTKMVHPPYRKVWERESSVASPSINFFQTTKSPSAVQHSLTLFSSFILFIPNLSSTLTLFTIQFLHSFSFF